MTVARMLDLNSNRLSSRGVQRFPLGVAAFFMGIAQSAERVVWDHEAAGSIPASRIWAVDL